MGLIHSRTDSGLIVAEYGSDGASVLRALKDHDPDLRLIPPGVSIDGAQRQHWAVYVYRGSERPPSFVLAWTDRAGNPLPLSHRLVDAVKERDLNGRGRPVDSDTMNRAHRARIEQQSRDDSEALVLEHVSSARSFRPAPRSVRLRMTRDKQRARGKKV